MNNKQLTIDELKTIPGLPVYCSDMKSFGIVKVDKSGYYAGIPFLCGVIHEDYASLDFEVNIEARKLKCYKITPDIYNIHF